MHENFLKVKLDFKEDLDTEERNIALLWIEKLSGSMGVVLSLWIGISFSTVIELLKLIRKCLFLVEENMWNISDLLTPCIALTHDEKW